MTQAFNLLSYLADLSTSSEHLVIVGDFNAPDIEWSSLTGTQSHSNLICDFVFHANLTQAVFEPTHTKGHILDIVLANCDHIQNLQVDTAHPVLSSDHYAITFDIDVYYKPMLKCKNRYVYDYRNADLNGLFDFISNCNFDICYQSNDIEYVWGTIYSYLHTAMDLFIPKRKCLLPSQPCWYNSEIRHRLKCLRTLKRKNNKKSTPHSLLLQQSLENELQSRM